jgi:hypothetical protein
LLDQMELNTSNNFRIYCYLHREHFIHDFPNRIHEQIDYDP